MTDTRIPLDDDLHRRAKAQAALADTYFKDYLTQAIRERVERDEGRLTVVGTDDLEHMQEIVSAAFAWWRDEKLYARGLDEAITEYNLILVRRGEQSRLEEERNDG